MTQRLIAAVATILVMLCASAGAQSEQPKSSGLLEGTSRLGRKLYALPDSDGAIRSAQQDLSTDPKNVAKVLKLSKAQAGKRQYREAIDTCTKAMKVLPANADLYLERGHRELGLRDFKAALTDLKKSVELNPKQLDAHYHLGMAHYFLREFGKAAQSFGHALELAQNSDSVIDCSNWLYVSRRRAGQTEAAAGVLTRITPDVKNTEPHLYFYLRLLHFYQGSLPENELLPPKPKGPSDIEGELSFNTINYGVGNWHLYNDHDRATAHKFFSRVVEGYAWNSWGFIGSELELVNAKP